MKKRRRDLTVCLLLGLIGVMGCQPDRGQQGEEERDRSACATDIPPSLPKREAGNGIYHWKTRFDLTSEQLEFLQRHEVKRIYLRLFDVEYEPGSPEKAVPIATTRFTCSLPEGVEYVPTVYITLEALRAMLGKEVLLADRIVTRILAMSKAHAFPKVCEVQLDCDWTESTRDSYYRLCSSARKILHTKGLLLSSTIRLHQLRSEAPPVDRGVLMLYNTGAFQKPDTKNSILDEASVRPYLKNVDYALPLEIAYPTFAWGLWFRNNRFQAILRTTDYGNGEYYERLANGTLRVRKDHYLERHALRKGDVIRLETSDYDEIMKVKRLAEKSLPASSAILYHLDMNNLKNYTPNEVNNIYHILP
ncbi:MAG: hypothetical protein IJ511_07875 [Bacteroides sp.]|nr:hypothetical protein [Bacteroides sp.]